MEGQPMQTQLSTANPALASLLETGYRMEETPPPTNPIDPPDNQGGGSTTTQPEPEEEDPSTQGG
jgi:hypothetical protein